MSDEGDKFEIKAKAKTKARAKNDVHGFSKAFRALRALMRQSKRPGAGGSSGSSRPSRGSPVAKAGGSQQRCSVRLTYAKNKGDGQWVAHGKYIARESASLEGARGFGSAGDDMPIAETLADWQKSKDEHLFKLIISPEFGERMNMQQFTKQFVAQMEKDLGTPLQWVAVEHFNTEHPHVHLALRGIDTQGQPLRIGKEYIKNGLRSRAQQLATSQLGYRTADDMKIAAERQIVQQRFTDLDRALQKKGQDKGDSYQLDYSGRIPASPMIREARLREIRRLQHLTTMGLARKTGPLSWMVDKSFEQTLRQIQTANDRLKSLHKQRATLSDPRLPLVVTDIRNIKRLAGRVIGTGLDEIRGIPYLLLEGTDAKVHYLYHDKAINEARRAGKMQPGSFVEIERRFAEGKDGRKRAQIVVTDKGSAEALLTDQKHLAKEALRGAIKQPKLPKPSNFGGWLGRYHQAVAHRATQLVSQGQLKPGPNGYEYQPARAKNHSR